MSRKFIRATIERAAKTFCQTLVVFLGATAIDVFRINWGQVLGLSLGAALLSVLTSIGSRQVLGTPDSPSLVDEKH